MIFTSVACGQPNPIVNLTSDEGVPSTFDKKQDPRNDSLPHQHLASVVKKTTGPNEDCDYTRKDPMEGAATTHKNTKWETTYLL